MATASGFINHSDANDSPIVEYQQMAAGLFHEFSEGMTEILSRRELSEQDRDNFAQTLQVVNAVSESFFRTAQQAGDLQERQRGLDIEFLRHACDTLMQVKEREFNQAQEELRLLREQAEFLQISYQNVAAAEDQVLPLNRREVHLKGIHPHFEGREELLQQIKGALDSPTPVVLYGPPGMGKSETAIAFANRNIQNYSVVWTIDAATDEQREQSYRGLAEALYLPLYRKDTLDKIVDRVHRKLEQIEENWLLIYDNVEEEIPVPERGGHILFTARSKELFPDYLALEVPLLSETESIALLKKVTHEEESAAMHRLVEKLAGYPLVLGQVARHIHFYSDAGMNIERYLAQSVGIDYSRMQGNTRYQQTLNQVLPPIFETLPPLAREWLGVCAHLCPDGIPRNYLKKWLELAHSDQAPERAYQILATLVNRGWLRFDRQSQTFSIHRLFQPILQNKESFQHAAKVLCHIPRAWDLEYIIDWDKTMNKAQKWASHAQKILESPYFEKLDEKYQGTLLHYLGYYGFYKGTKEDFECTQRALVLRKRALGSQHPDVASTHNLIGKYLIGKKLIDESLQHFEEAHRIWGKCDESKVGGALNNIGLIHFFIKITL